MTARSPLVLLAGQPATLAATDTLVGSVAYGAPQSLSAAQAAQAVANLGLNLQLADGQCVLRYGSATTLILDQCDGNNLVVNGLQCTIPSGGVTGTLNASSTPAAAASTLFYAYAVETGGVVSALELSTTAFVVDAYGRRYKSGDPTRRYVGAVYTNASGQIEDDPAFRGVFSYFNRRNRRLFSAQTGLSIQVVSGTEMAIGSPVVFVCDEKDDLSAAILVNGYMNTPGGPAFAGAMLDGTRVGGLTVLTVSSANYQANATVPVACSASAVGQHSLALDMASNGSASIFVEEITISGNVRQ